MAEQERELEKYRNEMGQEVAREKDKQQYLENEKYCTPFNVSCVPVKFVIECNMLNKYYYQVLKIRGVQNKVQCDC